MRCRLAMGIAIDQADRIRRCSVERRKAYTASGIVRNRHFHTTWVDIENSSSYLSSLKVDWRSFRIPLVTQGLAVFWPVVQEVCH